MLLLAQQGFEVMDMCEGALRFRRAAPCPFSVGDLLQAGIRFRNGESIQVKGQVLRIDGESVVIVIRPPIPWSTVVSEQRRLASRYPGYR